MTARSLFTFSKEHNRIFSSWYHKISVIAFVVHSCAARPTPTCLGIYFWIICKTRMWANAQRDGRPAEYSWHPLFNPAKFGWRPLLECRAVTKPRRETRWNLLGFPKQPNRSQLLVGQSSPYCEDMWRRYCCLTSFFFRLSIRALVAKI